MVALPDFTPLQGGVPIMSDGQIIGGVGVSGASSAQQDEELAIAGAESLTNQKTSAVLFYDAETVKAAFSKGAVLDDGSNGENYMVHASRREKSGMSEVHELDTDIIYVLDGTAVFVTGGKSVNAKQIAPNEFRGSAVENGETRNLKKGDVVIVPKGTPHWFKEVSGAFLYYVVKVHKRKELNFAGVYSIYKGKLQLLTKEFTGPNGIAFSPDEKYLYVGNWDEKKKTVYRYEVKADGTIKNGKLFFDFTNFKGEDAIDGIKVDTEGNLYISAPGGLQVLSKDGKHLGTIIVPQHVHNMAWGDDDGKTLYLCARNGLYRMRLNFAGVRPMLK